MYKFIQPQFGEKANSYYKPKIILLVDVIKKVGSSMKQTRKTYFAFASVIWLAVCLAKQVTGNRKNSRDSNICLMWKEWK